MSNVVSALNWSGVYIYIYIYIYNSLNTLSSGKSCLVAPGVAVAPWATETVLSGATSSGQSGIGSDGNEEALHIPQNSSITGASPSDCLVLYPEHLLVSWCILQPQMTGPISLYTRWAKLFHHQQGWHNCNVLCLVMCYISPKQL